MGIVVGVGFCFFFPQDQPIIFVFLMLIILKQAKRVLLVIYVNWTFL